jgi:PBP1b-binding outer membrane lipoprotein LpoB
MKKIIIIAFAILTTGLVSSCTKDNSVKPATTQKTVVADKSDLGVGD